MIKTQNKQKKSYEQFFLAQFQCLDVCDDYNCSKRECERRMYICLALSTVKIQKSHTHQKIGLLWIKKITRNFNSVYSVIKIWLFGPHNETSYLKKILSLFCTILYFKIPYCTNFRSLFKYCNFSSSFSVNSQFHAKMNYLKVPKICCIFTFLNEFQILIRGAVTEPTWYSFHEIYCFPPNWILFCFCSRFSLTIFT